MILIFPSFEKLSFALKSGMIPADCLMAPVRISKDESERIYVETKSTLNKETKDRLKNLNVLGSRRHANTEIRNASCWLELIPITALHGSSNLSSQTPVLFELPSFEALSQISSEMLRLGNDRQSYRIMKAKDQARVFLRVLGPPYYTLLQAIDSSDSKQADILAYWEAAPRIWLQWGYTHPLISHLEAPKNQAVLIRRGEPWQYLPDGEFEEIYQSLNLAVPEIPSDWSEGTLPEKITIPLRLIASNSPDIAELWVFREDGFRQLDTLVRELDERLLEQLRFAVGHTPEGAESVIIAASSSRKASPVLALDRALAFKSYWRIPNLFIPVGTHLHPTIRRDVITKLLAEDRDRRVWLYPSESGEFRPESIPENAFRPLANWIDYVVDAHAEELNEWMASTQFDFEGFICSDGGPSPKVQRERQESSVREPKKSSPGKTKSTRKAKAENDELPQEQLSDLSQFAVEQTPIKPPSEWKIRCDELELQFREIEGPLDHPERIALWPELARANAGIGIERRSDAAVCWLNAIWEQPEREAEYATRWLETETPIATVNEAEFDRYLALKNPSISESRFVIARFLSLSHLPKRPSWLHSRLPLVQTYLTANEPKLPIRAVWLAAVRLSALSQGDALGLARIRDQLLNRLLEKGLSAEQDLPSFLRFAGAQNSDRIRMIRERTLEIHHAARSWAEKSLKVSNQNTPTNDVSATLAYLDLMFAFALAKLGEHQQWQSLIQNAEQSLTTAKGTDTKSIASQFLIKVFRFRIQEASTGKPHGGQLPQELLDELETIHNKGGKVVNDPHKLAHYVINRLLEQSEIAEPHEKSDPYSEWKKHGDELKKEALLLTRIKDNKLLGKRMQELFGNAVPGRTLVQTQFVVLCESLHLAPRVGSSLALEWIAQVPQIFQKLGTDHSKDTDHAEKQGKLLERSLFLASHFDRPDLVQILVDAFINHVQTRSEEQRFVLINTVANRSLRSLRKVGLRDEIDKLLHRLQKVVLNDKPLSEWRIQYETKVDLWTDALETLLKIASGWLTFGMIDQAIPVLELARESIHSSNPPPNVRKFTSLCCAYLSALGQGPVDFGLPKMLEFFEHLGPSKIPVTFTSAPYYSRLHLNLFEEVVLSIVSDDLAVGQTGQRWLDEDEYIVRRRIHRDMRAVNQSTGV